MISETIAATSGMLGLEGGSDRRRHRPASLSIAPPPFSVPSQPGLGGGTGARPPGGGDDWLPSPRHASPPHPYPPAAPRGPVLVTHPVAVTNDRPSGGPSWPGVGGGTGSTPPPGVAQSPASPPPSLLFCPPPLLIRSAAPSQPP